MEETININPAPPEPPRKKTNKTIILVLILLAVAAIFTALRMRGIALRTAEVRRETKVATDPKFAEVEGGLLPGFPEVPVYPGAKLIGSSYTTLPDNPNKGYRAKWEVENSVLEVVDWYRDELAEEDWVFEPPDDPDAEGEQIIIIQKSGWSGFIAVEVEEKDTEIVIDVAETGL